MTVKNLSYLFLMRAVWSYAGTYRWRYLVALCGITVGMAVYMLQPYFMGKFFNLMQSGLDDPDHFHQALVWLLATLAMNPLSWFIYGPLRVVERQAAYFVRENFVQSSYRKLQKLPYAWHQNFHTGQLYDRVRQAEDALEHFTSHQFRYITALVNFMGPTIALLFLFKWFGLFAMIVVFLAVRLALFFDKKLVPLYHQGNELSHTYAGVFSDYLANIRTIIALRLGRETEKELLHRYAARRPIEWREYRLTEWKWFSIDVISEGSVAALMIVALYMFRDGNSALHIGTMVMLFQYLIRFSNVFSSFGNLYGEVVKHAATYRAVQVIDHDYDAAITSGQIVPDDNITAQTWQHIAIRDVHFAYGDATNRAAALVAIDLDFRAGEKIAFVGASGAGKSSLMTLLRGLYRADKGHVTIDGHAYDTLLPLAGMGTLIPQDPEIFENTIRYNITFGVAHSDDEILEACRIAGFDSVLTELPNGLDSDIREKGVNLSGGQKQRLALARGIFAIQNSSLVLMDEPTSSVDTLTELAIFDRLFTAFADKTIIASVHRLHLLPRFDRLYFMDKGRIVESGTLPALLAANGDFAALWQAYQDEQRVADLR